MTCLPWMVNKYDVTENSLVFYSISPRIQHWIWTIALHAGPGTDFDNLLRLLGSSMHLAVRDQGDQELLENAQTVLAQAGLAKVQLFLQLDPKHALLSSLLDLIMGNLPKILYIR